MKKRIICSILILSCMFGMSAHASEDSHAHADEIIDSPVPAEKVMQLEQAAAASEDYGTQLYATSLDGIYEDNDSMVMAYPYSKTTKIEHKDTETDGHYNCYYAYTRLETEDDVDYFRVALKPGECYVAALKNVWTSQVRDIRLYYQKSNGEWRVVSAKEKLERQTIFHFIPEVSTYYIEISGNAVSGYAHDSATNWFAVEKDGAIDERPHIGSPKPYCSL